jgi:hypothetical protein
MSQDDKAGLQKLVRDFYQLARQVDAAVETEKAAAVRIRLLSAANTWRDAAGMVQTAIKDMNDAQASSDSPSLPASPGGYSPRGPRKKNLLPLHLGPGP